MTTRPGAGTRTSRHRLFVAPLLGVIVATALSAAAARSGAPAFVVMAARVGDGLRMFVEGPIPVPDAGEVHEGDYIGISRDGVIAVADSAVMCARLLLSRLLSDSHELVTLIEGEGAKVGDTRSIEEWLSDEYPDVALEVHQGGQPLYPYLLGIE